MKHVKDLLLEGLQRRCLNNFTMNDVQRIAKEDGFQISRCWASEVLTNSGFQYDAHHAVWYKKPEIKSVSKEELPIEILKLQLKQYKELGSVEEIICIKEKARELVNQVEKEMPEIEALRKNYEQLVKDYEKLQADYNELQCKTEKIIERYKDYTEVQVERSKYQASYIHLRDDLTLLNKNVRNYKYCIECSKARKCSENNFLFNKPCDFVKQISKEIKELNNKYIK